MGLVAGGPDPLFQTALRTSEVLGVPELRDLDSDGVLGDWSLDAATIRFLWTQLMRDQPRVIVEWGSGVSTVVFGTYAALRESRGSGRCVVFSVEQDLAYKAETKRKLAAKNLADIVNVLHAPVREGPYDLAELGVLPLEVLHVDWVVIDGPAGPPGCRYWTLPALIGRCGCGARWFLDDAFRDGELGILQRWRGISGITVDGIYPIGKGLATGRVR